MLIIKHNVGSRSGNMFNFLIHCISDNLLYYRHEEISLEYFKQCSFLFRNMPDKIYFPEFRGGSQNKDTVEGLFIEPKKPVRNHHEIIDQYIKPFIDYSSSDLAHIDFDNSLVIHIRSGDVFQENFIDDKAMFDVFRSPPLAFYKEIVESTSYSMYYIVSENYALNPVIPYLCRSYPNVRMLSNDLSFDFRILLHSKYFAPGHSDLSRMAMLLSAPEKKTYISRRIFPNMKNTLYYDYSDYFNINVASFDQYVQLIMHWTR